MPTRTLISATVDELKFNCSLYELVRELDPATKPLRIDKKPVNAVITLDDDNRTEVRVRRDAKLEWFFVEPTAEEREAERVKSLLEHLDRRVVKRGEELYAAAVVRTTDMLAGGAHSVSSFVITDLITATAHAEVAAWVKNVLTNATGEYTDAQRLARVEEIALEKVTSFYGAHSTSAVSNVLENAKHQAWVELLRDLKSGMY